nr:MAG TPA: hypothetical protein [Inoviridae sp.]
MTEKCYLYPLNIRKFWCTKNRLQTAVLCAFREKGD